MTECRVSKVISVSQRVKPSIVSKLFVPIMWLNLMSLTATVLAKSSNHFMLVNLSSVPVMQVILLLSIPLCKAVSNFVCGCQSVTFFRKPIYVNRKRPREWLVNKKSSRQHDFMKPFSKVNILIIPICFYELAISYFIFHCNFCNNNVENVSHKSILSRSYRFYQISFSPKIIRFIFKQLF